MTFAIPILFAATLLYLNKNTSKESQTHVPAVEIDAGAQMEYYNSLEIPEEEIIKHKKLMAMGNLLYGDNGLMLQFINDLTENGYSSHSLTLAYSLDDIQINIKLSDREASDTEREALKALFLEILKENNLDPNIFTLIVNGENEKQK